MGQGFAIALGRLSWDVFGTLTFRGAHVPTSAVQYRLAWAHLHHAAKLCPSPYSKLLICLRHEFGELGGRPHFHYLLGGTGHANFVTLSRQLRASWGSMAGGFADIRVYDRRQGGSSYVCKCLSGGANQYEVGKFDSADDLNVSAAVFRVIRNNDVMGTRGALQRVKKPLGETGSAGGANPSCIGIKPSWDGGRVARINAPLTVSNVGIDRPPFETARASELAAGGY